MIEKSYLYREIREQPEAIERVFKQSQDHAGQIATAVRERGIDQVFIAARGTSDNAGRYAKYVFGALNGLPVALAAPSLFSIYKKPPNLSNALVLGISQSGQSPDIVAVLAEARQQGALTAVLTNIPTSPLAQQAEFVLDLAAGEERAVAATKTYTAQLAAVARLSASMAQDSQLEQDLGLVPEAVASSLDMHTVISDVAPRYRYMTRCIVIGRGYNYATAFELALKLKELTYTIVEPYSSADFLHGPLALIEHGFPVIVIAPTGAMLADLQDLVGSLRNREAEVLAISDNADLLSQAQIPLALPETLPEWLSPIMTIVPGQLLAMYLAHARGYDVDQPRAIRKVTETQ